MAEKLTFTSPQAVATPATEASVQYIVKRRSPWVLMVQVLDDTGRLREFQVTGALAQTLIVTLNKSNNSTKSEERRILEWLQANVNPDTPGVTYLPAGTYSGTPD